MAEVSPPDFVMYGARAAMLSGLAHMEEQVKAIERAVSENPAFAFDLAKALVESACKTIMSERSIGYSDDDDLPRLFRTLTQQLPMLPDEASGDVEARRSLTQILGGLSTTLQGICELRNSHGFASHGAEGPRPVMETVQAILAAQAADAIVGFLNQLHRRDRVKLSGVRLQHGDEDNAAFNEYIDEVNEVVRIFYMEYRPSEVLFSVDYEAYRDQRVNYIPDAPESEEAVGTEDMQADSLAAESITVSTTGTP